MTEEAGFTEPGAAAPGLDDDGQPGTGPVAEDTAAAAPVTEAPGAAAAEPAELEQDGVPAEVWETAEPAPPVDADPQEVAEEAAAAEPETHSATAGAPDPVLPPFIPADGVAPWLREILTWLHERLRALEG